MRDDLNIKDRHLQAALSENERLNELIKEFEELQKPSDETLVESDSMEQIVANLKTVITFAITLFLIHNDTEGKK